MACSFTDRVRYPQEMLFVRAKRIFATPVRGITSAWLKETIMRVAIP